MYIGILFLIWTIVCLFIWTKRRDPDFRAFTLIGAIMSIANFGNYFLENKFYFSQEILLTINLCLRLFSFAGILLIVILVYKAIKAK